jgi:hypothetical protein
MLVDYVVIGYFITLGVLLSSWVLLSSAVGSEHMLQQFKHHTDHRRIRGMAKARALLQSA